MVGSRGAPCRGVAGAMPDGWKRFLAPLVFGLLAVGTIVTMVADRRALEEGGRDLPWWQGWVLEAARPVHIVLSAPVDTVRDLWSGYVDLVAVHHENLALQARIDELEEENLQFREALVASGHLQRIAAMRDDYEVPMLPTEIIGLDVSPWFRSALVDRGAGAGVRSGQPAITNDGVVGLVTATSPRAARLMLLLDRQSAVDAMVQRSRTRGIVRGTGTGELELEFVARDGDVRDGDVIVTSGLGGVYPKSLRIGRVARVIDPGGRLLQIATLTPAVDFGRLEQVFVMLWRGRTMDLLYGGHGDPPPDPGEPLATASTEGAAP